MEHGSISDLLTNFQLVNQHAALERLGLFHRSSPPLTWKDAMQFAEIACETFRPLIRRLPRGRGIALRLLGGWHNRDAQWANCRRPYRIFHDTSIDAWILADLRDRFQRHHYYAGRHHDYWNPWLMHRVLKAGDTYIDIGANVGLHTIRAAKIVGSVGAVCAFEPNPRAAGLLRAQLSLNDLDNVQVMELGLSDQRTTAEIRGRATHWGAFSFRPTAGGDTVHSARLATGDEILPSIKTAGSILVKIDVEGFELKVLTGVSRWLSEHRPRCLNVEVTPDWIEELGGTAETLFELMRSLGYVSYLPVCHRTVAGRVSFTLTPTTKAIGSDILFVSDPHQLSAYITSVCPKGPE